MSQTRRRWMGPVLIAGALVLPTRSAADLILGPGELVQAGGVDIAVPGYSVPSFVLWDGDALPDLVVGQGGAADPEGKVRVYRNVGASTQPAFTDYFYVQSAGSDLIVPGGG